MYSLTPITCPFFGYVFGVKVVKFLINQNCVADFVVGGSHMSVVDQLVNVFLYLLGVGYEAGDVLAAVAGGEDDVVGVDFGVPEVAEYLGSAPAVHYGVELAVEVTIFFKNLLTFQYFYLPLYS